MYVITTTVGYFRVGRLQSNSFLSIPACLSIARKVPFHILATMYGYNNGFIGDRVVVKLVRTFGAFENKVVLF
jgi:hypothetical protein